MADETGTKTEFKWRSASHEPQRRLLEKSILNKRLAHAYIFSGPAEADILSFSRNLAQFLVCQDMSGCDECGNCRTLKAGSNADYLEIAGTEAIKIESIRDLAYKLALKPYAAAYKVAVIGNAHNLTTEASNALLKVLEEPKPNTVLILATDNVHKLLPTISSRAQKMHFVAPPEVDGVIAGDDVKEVHESYDRFVGKSLGDKLILAAELAEKETEEVNAFLTHALRKMQKVLRENPSVGQVERVRAVLRAQRLLGQNVNAKLLLSELMVNSN